MISDLPTLMAALRQAEDYMEKSSQNQTKVSFMFACLFFCLFWQGYLLYNCIFVVDHFEDILWDTFTFFDMCDFLQYVM